MVSHTPIVTRFAPSPTGMLHIGGARTALFNWVFARAHGGTFVLRIEDTDRARSTDEACAAILDGLKWLGIDWDDEPIFQFARASRHREVAERLVDEGTAYRDYTSAQEQEAAGQAMRRAERVPSLWRDRSSADWPADLPYVVRLKAPDEGQTVIEDAVQGTVVFQNSELDDLVLLRSDLTPTYMLAVVVDDHDMNVTHIIRGDDHLTNAARQKLIWEAAGWKAPVFAHIPLIHGEDGKKLSKRHGAVGAEEFRDAGYLPQALRNYLLRLGWGHGDMEYFTDEEARAVFSLEAISKGAAQLDFAKLDAVNAWHIRRLDSQTLAELVRPWLVKSYGDVLPSGGELVRLVDPLKERLTRLSDGVEQMRFIFQPRPLDYGGKAGKPLRGVDPEVFRATVDRLASLDDGSFDAPSIEAALNSVIGEYGIQFGAIGGPIRAAVCAGAPAPDLPTTLALIGKDAALARLNDALTEIGSIHSK
jgi:glutamyl-tRNA synthetase